jgi:predicted DNA-binding ArsR family transcriptional regulator
MLPVFLDLEASGHYMQPEWPSVEVVGEEQTVGVKVFAPSIVAAGGSFDVSVRSEDRFYNRPSGRIPGYDVFVNGSHYARILGGGQAVTVLDEIRIEEPGVYRFEARSTEGTIKGTSNPVWVREDPPHRILWGDTHGHIAFADGQGTPEGYFRFARDDARLDFVALSEHDFGLDDLEWIRLQQLAEEYGAEGRLIPIQAFEWTVGPPGGHHNVYYRNIRSERVGGQITPVLRELYSELRRRLRVEDVLTIPHAHSPGNWQISDPDIERLIEITSTHGTFEWFGNRYLEQGWEIGFVGSSDNHTEHPGYTGTNTTFHTQFGGLAAVMTAEKSYDAIFTAMRDLAAYATGGERIILDATLNGAPMGRRLAASDSRRFSCRVMGTAPIDTIDVVKNGDVIYSKRYLTGEVTPRAWVRVGFESSSEVPTYRAPRYQRRWAGSLSVEGARLVGFEAAGLENQYVEWARLDPDDPNRIEFLVETRGRLDGLVLELHEASADTAVTVRAEGRGQTERLPAEPALDRVFRLGDARDGVIRIEQTLTDERIPATFIDAVSIQIFDPESSLDQEFEYVDLAEPGDGDYYYLRVTQIDGELAWSSPWWVGGKRPVAQPLAAGEESAP